jgi:hypothetical protein
MKKKNLKCSVSNTKFCYINGGGEYKKVFFTGQSPIGDNNPVSNQQIEKIKKELRQSNKMKFNTFNLCIGVIEVKNNYKITIEEFFEPIKNAFSNVGIELLPTFYKAKRYDGGATSINGW